MIQEKIIIEGYVKGMKFSKTLNLTYNPDHQEVEEALIYYYGSRALSFEELAIEQGWQDSYWTYPTYLNLVM
ncbi:hypothetical protein GCM10010954_13590 [Halobacillus andaensis]|uniref:Uncharacterized protein n=1 Tax=Halobacillus andaensis TaxID=1176239 RepID=A0A917B100_HALAA|nr:hypothetical protein [Halobacillus andaensis]MBP2004160.1 hypothetical protein [Halobacillus andaensis]GGF16264.1 hypothetical protein GCM10010954_13590 [Halobacillus andaensis]